MLSMLSSHGYEASRSSTDLSYVPFGRKTPQVGRKVRPPGTPRTPGNGQNRSIFRYVTAAICEGRGNHKGRIGLAWADPESVEWVMMEFHDSAGYMILLAQLQLIAPSEILLADALNDKSSNVVIMEAIKDVLPMVTLTGIQKRFFNQEHGVGIITLLASDFAVEEIADKNYCVSAMGALIRFIEHKSEISFHQRTLPFKYKDVTKSCLLDVNSWKNLEIVNDSLPRRESRTLLSVIDKTITDSGYRMLRANVMQPLTHQNLIEERLDAVNELLEDNIMLEQLIQVLNRVRDLDSVVNVCCRNITEKVAVTRPMAENQLSQLLCLLQTMKIVKPLHEMLARSKSKLLIQFVKALEDDRFDSIQEILFTYLDDSALVIKKSSLSVKQQKLFAIKPNVDPRVDTAREMYTDKLNKVEEYGTELEEHLPGANTRIAYSVARGFHYVWMVNNPRTARLPSIFMNDVRHRTCITFTSTRLLKYNDRITVTEEELIYASTKIGGRVIDEVRPFVGVLYSLMDTLAQLDMLQSLAVYASNTETSRPIFANDIVVMQGCHPILNALSGDTVVRNDTYLTRDSSFGIITGPNMAGKSTLLKQICQLALMGQIGCFVPAILCKMPIFRRVFSRVGHNDSLSQNLSAFALEMREMAAIMQTADEDTLIVIDELARSTSTEEGIGISYAIAEDLIRKKSFVFFATHFLDLTSLDVAYVEAENYHFKSLEEDYSSRHKLFKGPYRGPLYGFELIQLANFPIDLIENAEKMAYKLRAENERKREMDRQTQRKRALLRTAHRLRSSFDMLKIASGDARKAYLSKLRESMREMLGDCELGAGASGGSSQDENREQNEESGEKEENYQEHQDKEGEEKQEEGAGRDNQDTADTGFEEGVGEKGDDEKMEE